MKKWVPWIVVLLAIALCMYSFAYFFVIPKTAQGLVPYKWKSFLLEKKRGEMIAFLGKPADSLMKENNIKWVSTNGNFLYTLIVHYRAVDSSSEKYSVSYDFKSNIFSRSGLIATDSLK